MEKRCKEESSLQKKKGGGNDATDSFGTFKGEYLFHSHHVSFYVEGLSLMCHSWQVSALHYSSPEGTVRGMEKEMTYLIDEFWRRTRPLIVQALPPPPLISELIAGNNVSFCSSKYR